MTKLDEFNKIENAKKNLVKLYDSFEACMNSSGHEELKNFNCYRFILLYNYCFSFFFKNKMQIFYKDQDFFSSFDKIKKEVVVKKPLEIINFYEKSLQNEKVFVVQNRNILYILYPIWEVATRGAIFKDHLTNEDFCFLMQNKNLLLTLNIEQQRKKLHVLFQKLNQIKNLSNEKCQTELFGLAEQFSQNLEICLELFFFRNSLIQNFFIINKFSFSKFSYLQLILLLDTEIFLYLNELLYFVKKFFEVYIEKNKSE